MIIKFKIFEKSYDNDIIRDVKTGKISNMCKVTYDKDMINFIKNNYDNVNSVDVMGWTPLLWATYNIDRKVMKVLIGSGADISFKVLHHIAGTKKMVDFYDFCIDKYTYEKDIRYKNLAKWIEKNYPEFVASKKYNL